MSAAAVPGRAPAAATARTALAWTGAAVVALGIGAGTVRAAVPPAAAPAAVAASAATAFRSRTALALPGRTRLVLPGRPRLALPDGTPLPRADTASGAPPLFTRSDLPWAGVVFGGVLLIEPLEGFERTVRAHTPSEPTGFDRAFVDAGEVAGHPLVDAGVALAAWGAGRLAGSTRLERAGLDAVETLVAADAVLVGGKVLLGRRRPEVTDDPDQFRPISFHESSQSYPSGHATGAFALAAVAVGEFPGQRWLPWVAWPAAGAVAASRVVGRKHWVTDVAAGAALGILSARVVLRFNAGRRRAARGGGRAAPGETDAGHPARRAPSLVLLPVPGGAGASLDIPLP